MEKYNVSLNKIIEYLEEKDFELDRNDFEEMEKELEIKFKDIDVSKEIWGITGYLCSYIKNGVVVFEYEEFENEHDYEFNFKEPRMMEEKDMEILDKALSRYQEELEEAKLLYKTKTTEVNKLLETQKLRRIVKGKE